MMIQELLPIFEAWMRGNSYREPTVTKYLWILRRAATKGDLLSEAFRLDLGTSYHRLARAAALAFARWAGPEVLEATRRRLSAVVRPREAPELPPPGLSDEDWAAYRRALAGECDPERALIELMVMSGMRLGDCLGIRRDRIVAAGASSATSIVIEVKGGKPAEYPYQELSGPLQRLARCGGGSWDEAWQLLCSPSRSGAAWRLRRVVVRVGKRARCTVRVYPHLLRHTVAYRALDRTGDIHLVSRLLQHSSVKVTEGYVVRRKMQLVGSLIE